MRNIMILIALVLIGCAGSRATPSDPKHSQWASKSQCQDLIDHLNRMETLSTRTPVGAKGLFDPGAHQQELNSRVRQCTISVTRADYACMISAGDMDQVDACSRRIY